MSQDIQQPMLNWKNIDKEASKAWWEMAYKVFLRNDPKGTICRHSELYTSQNDWNVYHFNYETHVPPAGTLNGVYKRAILVVISRSGLYGKDTWQGVFLPDDAQDVPDLDDKDKELINCVIDLMYKADGSSRPFIY